MLFTFSSWNMPAIDFLIYTYTYVGTRQRNRRSCPTSKQRRWSFHSHTLTSSSLLQDTHVKSIFCLRIDIKMLKYHLIDVTSLGSRDPKVTKINGYKDSFAHSFIFYYWFYWIHRLRFMSSFTCYVLRNFLNRKPYSHIECYPTVRSRKNPR